MASKSNTSICRYFSLCSHDFSIQDFSTFSVDLQLEERTKDLWLISEPQQANAGMASGDVQPSTSNGRTCTPTPINSNSSHDMYHAPYDWQITKTTLRERGQHLLESGQWSDCKFIVGTEPHQQVIHICQASLQFLFVALILMYVFYLS